MLFVASPTELTTGVTDGVLALEGAVLVAYLWRGATVAPWRARLWCSVFALLATSSLLGAVAHGLALAPGVREALWLPLYLCLGLAVALVAVGAVADWRGQSVAQRRVRWALAIGLAFCILTTLQGGDFLIFVVYEAVALLSVLGIYAYLAVARRQRGAGVVVLGVVLTLVAAGVQASPVTLYLVVPFDHNGVFHLLQLLSTATLAVGLRRGMTAPRS